jgi:3-deoxy-7-phosphoheptulonate synthase
VSLTEPCADDVVRVAAGDPDRLADDTDAWILAAAQQPDWRGHPDYAWVRSAVGRLPPLVPEPEVAAARRAMRSAALGEAVVLQAGDCAESLDDCAPPHVRAVCDVLDGLADRLARQAGRPCLRIARIAGQFAKPRSRDTEVVGGCVLPVFRGHLINSEVPSRSARRHDPGRMLRAHRAGSRVLETLGARPDGAGSPAVWTSHEALVLEYELAQRVAGARPGQPYLASTHIPWVGARTAAADSAHVRFLASVSNCVALKVGPWLAPAELVACCARLDPDREPGRLALIFRLGRRHAAELLPPLLRAVRRAGHPAVLLCDPMHGNTFRTASGIKTRLLSDIQAEVAAFQDACGECGVRPGGLHLEVAAADVTECIGAGVPDDRALTARYRTLCDPRLNPRQAGEVVDRWRP